MTHLGSYYLGNIYQTVNEEINGGIDCDKDQWDGGQDEYPNGQKGTIIGVIVVISPEGIDTEELIKVQDDSETKIISYFFWDNPILELFFNQLSDLIMS